MRNKTQNGKNATQREKVIWMALIPQSALLLLSILWINISPKDNVFKYFKFSFKVLGEGVLTGIVLAMLGYGFYRLAKKIKSLHSTVELFEQVLAPTFKSIKIFDIVSLSLISGFCEEVFFRGLLLPEHGIIISSLAFGVLHLPGFKYWVYAVWATLSGMLMGWLFLMSGSLWLPIVAHSVNNIIGFFMLKRLKG